jgi:FAD/FMN-containing dehydrogenase
MLPRPALRGPFRTDPRALAAYSEGAGIYRILPKAVAVPTNIEDVKSLVVWATEHGVAIVPRGAGSAMGGGNVGDGLVIDLNRLQTPFHIDATARRARTAAGVTHEQLNAAAAHHGLRLPPDPSSGRWATVGGMVATNAAGARSVRYGSVRRWVEGLKVITAEAEMITLRRGQARGSAPVAVAVTRFDRDAAPRLCAAASLISSQFPRTRKNASGYALDAYAATGDLLDLLIGSEGTLGIVTEIEWRLDQAPAFRAGMQVQLRSLDHLSPVLAALRGYEPSALELLDRSFLDLVGTDARTDAGLGAVPEAILLVELEGDSPDELRRALTEAAAAAQPWSDRVETAKSSAESDRLWKIRHAASPILAGLPETRRSLQVIEDACVPIENIGEYIRAVRRLAAERDLPVVMFGHAGDGHIHVNLLPELARAGWEANVAALLDDVTAVVVRLGGTPSGEHGDGRLRAGTLLDVYGTEIVELFHEVKRAFDPMGIFNPGIILPSGEPPISRLKVGSGAAAIPEDIQRELREIEVRGGYGRSRLELAEEPGARS